MSQELGGALAIQLNDGRIVVATPGPEDQGRLAQLNTDIVFLTAAERGLDTAGHGSSSEVEVDVEGHAMTLRLPTGADAEALRKALAIGAVTATLVAAGAIAAMQGSPAAPAAPDVPGSVTRVHAPGPAPAPAADFQIRREQAIDRMLEAPAMEISVPDNPSNESRGSISTSSREAGTLSSGSAAQTNSARAPSQAASSGEYEDAGSADQASEAASAEFAADRNGDQ